MLFLPNESSQTLEMAQSGMNSAQSTVSVVCAGRGGKKRDEGNLLVTRSASAPQDLISQHKKEGCSVMTGVGCLSSQLTMSPFKREQLAADIRN